jgi:hypothetical protein
MDSNHNIYRVFLGGVLAMAVVALLVTLLTEDCFQWVAFAAATVVLYRVIRGEER